MGPPSQDDVREVARHHHLGAGETVALTPRLILRRWRADDLGPFAAMGRDPAVMRHLGPVLDTEASDALARYADACFEVHGFGLAALERSDDASFLGFVGLHRHRWYPGDVEIGWRLAQHAWGQGFATEAATAWVALAGPRFGLDRLISITTPDNAPSQRVMRRLGMHRHQTALQEGREIVVHALALAGQEPPGGG